MDKVQFNIEVVNMRKIVKRVKVLIAHSLTRHIAKLRKKKGSEQQVLKNKRRAERFVAEIEAMKDLQPDTITKKAATMKKTLQEVLNNPKSSAQDRVLARIVYHKLIQAKVTRFKDMVTKDFLRTGNKKYKRLKKTKFELEAEARLKEEEDYQVTLEKMVSADKMDDHSDPGNDIDDTDDEDDDIDDDDYSKKLASKMRTFAKMDRQDVQSGHGSNDEDEFPHKFLKKMRTSDQIHVDHDSDNDDDSQKLVQKSRTMDRIVQDNDDKNDDKDSFDIDAHILERMMIRKMMQNDDKDSSDDEDSLEFKERAQATQDSPRKPQKDESEPLSEKRLKDKEDQRISQDAELPEKSHSRVVGKRKVDSMFLGSLSSMQDDDITEMLQTTEKDSRKQRGKAKQLQKQQSKARPAQEKTKEPAKTTRHKVPMVDQPNPVRHTPGEKLIPGINCHPDLPPRHAPRDTHEKRSGRKPFPTKPQSKQLPAKPSTGQTRHGAKQHPAHQGKYPTSTTIASPKKPAAKEALHPSWEASKKRKEESKIVPFQGKKITFDDD